MDHIIFKGKSSNNDVEYMAIVDKKMRILAHSDIKKTGEVLKEAEGRILKNNGDGTVVREIPFSRDKIFEIYTPILFKGKSLGSVRVGVNKSVLLNAQSLARKRIFWLFASTLLVAVIGVIGISILITRSIQELASGVEELEQGKWGRPLRVYSRDELGKLTESFNAMSRTIMEQKEELAKYTQELEEAYISTVRILAMAIDVRDPSTLGHSMRVAVNSLMIGEEIGLSKKELEELEVASLFHDVGKLKTPDSILFKNRTLDSTEVNEVRHHPEVGAEILKKAKSLQRYIAPVRHHHEYYNGQGYPDGLEGDKIPLYAAIIAIADTFDAITSRRPYKRALSKAAAIQELKKGAGKQFHPDLVKAFLMAMERGRCPGLHPYLAEAI
jgi:putative nucleotidyltransferase with HDIG domain